MNNLKQKKYQEIFEILDDDEDGFVSAKKINIKGLPTEILVGFAPLLIEMEEANLNLDIYMFIGAADRLIKVLFDFIFLIFLDDEYS